MELPSDVIFFLLILQATNSLVVVAPAQIAKGWLCRMRELCIVYKYHMYLSLPVRFSSLL